MGARSSIGTNNTPDYERPEAGVVPARCIQVVELGTHKNTHPQAKPDAVKQELLIVWELSGEKMQDGRPFVVNKRYTNSLNEKAVLRKDLASWRGKPFTEAELTSFELKNILDKCCLLNLVETASKNDSSKTYINIASIMPLPKGMACDERVNDLVDFGIDDRNGEEYKKLYPWVQKIVDDSHEAKGLIGDDVPFDLGSDQAF